jgi:hypothetical protein
MTCTDNKDLSVPWNLPSLGNADFQAEKVAVPQKQKLRKKKKKHSCHEMPSCHETRHGVVGMLLVVYCLTQVAPSNNVQWQRKWCLPFK